MSLGTSECTNHGGRENDRQVGHVAALINRRHARMEQSAIGRLSGLRVSLDSGVEIGPANAMRLSATTCSSFPSTSCFMRVNPVGNPFMLAG